MDKQGTCVVVSIFNLSSGKGVIIGDSVAIPEPFVVDNNFTYNNKVSFMTIKIHHYCVILQAAQFCLINKKRFYNTVNHEQNIDCDIVTKKKQIKVYWLIIKFIY